MARKNGCVFCGGGPRTREHLLPDWLKGVLGSPLTEHTRSQGQQTHDQWLANAFTSTVKVVCKRCNEGWMSRLESAAKPYVGALALGRRTSLDPFVQPIVAAWCFKTALTFDQAGAGGPRIWPEEYRRFLDSRVPAPHAQVWISAYDWQPTDLLARHLTRIDRDHPAVDGSRPGIDLIKSTLSVGAFAANVLIPRNSDGTVVQEPVGIDFKSVHGRFRRVWPITFAFDWPPQEGPLSPHEFDSMAVVGRA